LERDRSPPDKKLLLEASSRGQSRREGALSTLLPLPRKREPQEEESLQFFSQQKGHPLGKKGNSESLERIYTHFPRKICFLFF